MLKLSKGNNLKVKKINHLNSTKKVKPKNS